MKNTVKLEQFVALKE
ncbi:TPA: ComC/BlpC family leader-containing pheromone/bacteriocin, partial [Streptococcus pneumoniae]|nr:ComC/BlpC family leader-containing pheromone/bacteriocin [Streptococcus pneumoniae]